MSGRLAAARGAAFLREDSRAEMDRVVRVLMARLAELNGVGPADCLYLMFSTTEDLRARNPATAAREAGWDLPLFSVREAEFEGSPPRCLRALLVYEAAPGRKARHAYVEGAEVLRPDLAELEP